MFYKKMMNEKFDRKKIITNFSLFSKNEFFPTLEAFFSGILEFLGFHNCPSHQTGIRTIWPKSLPDSTRFLGRDRDPKQYRREPPHTITISHLLSNHTVAQFHGSVSFIKNRVLWTPICQRERSVSPWPAPTQHAKRFRCRLLFEMRSCPQKIWRRQRGKIRNKNFRLIRNFLKVSLALFYGWNTTRTWSNSRRPPSLREYGKRAWMDWKRRS